MYRTVVEKYKRRRETKEFLVGRYQEIEIEFTNYQFNSLL